MPRTVAPIDQNFIIRCLHLHTLKYIFHLGRSKVEDQVQLPSPRFQMFRPFPKQYKGLNDRFKLFKNIFLAFRWEISVGILFAVIYASLNLLLSQIIKQFMEVMQLTQLQRVSSYVTEKFIILHILKMIFGIHMKRKFTQIAIMVESTISKKLVKKALLLDAQYRKRIPQTQVFQLQNVDLKLIFTLFSNLYLGIQIPFTIGIAIIWLFSINNYLGVIALYWFIIIFLIQRALDDRMRKCNLTKLGLIDQRSKLNYQFMEKITLARVVKHQSMMVQKNNDLFLQENHDHTVFYRYASLYDIAQLLLPIAVVVTSLVFEQSNGKPMTVQQLYLILSMLGICYRPMKDFRVFSISLSDGFHSLRRLTDYFQLPQQHHQSNLYKKNNAQPPLVAIAKGTIANVVGRGDLNIQLQNKFHVQVKEGERLIVLGRKGQGSSLFLNMLVGQIPIRTGSLRINGKIAYLSQQNFFLIDTLANNLSFYNQSCSRAQIEQVYEQLGLIDELSLSKGLDQIVEINKYNENQLKLISIARIFCSKADIYILDNPFSGLNIQYSLKVDKLLRKKQLQGKIVITALKKVQNFHDNDKVLILYLASTKEYGLFKDLVKNQRSYIDNFMKKQTYDFQDIDETALRNIVHEFQYKVRKAMMFRALFQKQSQQKMKKQKLESIVKCLTTYSASLVRQSQYKKEKQINLKHEQNITTYFLKFLNSCHLSQSSYVLIIIIAVEVLHIFIHFFIGHEYQHRAKQGIKSLRTLMFYEIVLTIGLSGLIYLQGEVSTYLAIITGNKLYKQSLQSLVHKELKWYGEQYSLRIADKFNHDYEEIYIAVHGILTVYKNVVILIATALFIGHNHFMVIIATIGVAVFYFVLLAFFRKAHSRIVKHYYDYKYEFVKVFNESIEGAQLIKIYGVGSELVLKAKNKYINFASYKLASSYISYGQNILCDLTSTAITAVALQFGTNVRMAKRTDIAVLATSILLLLNLADVLKAILDAAIQVEIFFRINMLPFMEIAPHQQIAYELKPYPKTRGFKIVFDSVLLKEDDQQVFEIYPLKMQIQEGEIICLCEQDETLRDNLLFGLTQNLSNLANTKQRNRTIFIGGVPICDFTSEALKQIIGVIGHDNFFLSGSLKSNISWRVKKFDEQQVLHLAIQLGINKDLKHFNKQGLETSIQEINEDLSPELSKKIAVLRILIRKPKIVIIKDTTPFVGNCCIVELLQKYNPGCTIIKITNSLEVAYDTHRIVLLEKLKIIEQGSPKKLQYDKLSKLGQMLRLCNEEAYVYRNRVSVLPHYRKSLQKISKMIRSKRL